MKVMVSIDLRSGTDKNKHGKTRKVRRTKPLAVPAATPERLTQLLENSLSPVTNLEPENSKLILIVDDTPTNLKVLFSCLETAGYRVLVTQNGENAVKIANTQCPDLILLDVLMPGIDGFETCNRLKAQPTTSDIPIIFLTALSETSHKVRGFDLGGVDYVTKPIQQEELLARIKTHLKLQEMQRALAAQNQQLQREISQRQAAEAKLIERGQQLQQSLDFTATIARITDKIRDSLDETQILTRVTEELVTTLDMEGCQIELYNDLHTTASIVYEYSPNLPPSQGIDREIDNFPELYHQLLLKSPLQFVDLKSEFAPQGMALTRLACPIFEEQEGSIGNLWLLRTKNQVFTTREIALVQQLASNCAIAIRQARLYTAAQIHIEELKKFDSLKDNFLKTIAHELRSPMTRIKIGAQTLQKLIQAEHKKIVSPNFSKVMGIFQQACDRQNQLVDDLLSLCYLDAKAQTIVFESIDLQIFLPEIVNNFIDIARDNDQQLTLDPPAELPLLSTDIATLERILNELLTNACKYTPARETITVTAKATNNSITIAITNTGIEIPADELPRIFDQFYRIPNHDPWQHGGTGIGLTLVSKLAKLIEAEIRVDSQADRTIFSVSFSPMFRGKLD